MRVIFLGFAFLVLLFDCTCWSDYFRVANINATLHHIHPNTPVKSQRSATHFERAQPQVDTSVIERGSIRDAPHDGRKHGEPCGDIPHHCISSRCPRRYSTDFKVVSVQINSSSFVSVSFFSVLNIHSIPFHHAIRINNNIHPRHNMSMVLPSILTTPQSNPPGHTSASCASTKPSQHGVPPTQTPP
jgi:hypothetical protein